MEGSSDELVILGLLKRQPAHGYELLRTVRLRGMGEYIPLAPASMYRALARLEEQGCITAQAEWESDRPERQTYAITPKGEVRLQESLLDHLQAALDQFDPLNAALTFGDLAPRRAIIKELRRRREVIAGAREEAEQLRSQSLIPTNGPLTFSRLRADRWAEHLEAELKWLNKAIAELDESRDKQVLPKPKRVAGHQVLEPTEHKPVGEPMDRLPVSEPNEHRPVSEPLDRHQVPATEVFHLPEPSAQGAAQVTQELEETGGRTDPRSDLPAAPAETTPGSPDPLPVEVPRRPRGDLNDEVLEPAAALIDHLGGGTGARVLDRQEETAVTPEPGLQVANLARIPRTQGLAIDVQDLRKRYNGVKAVDGISFQVEEREIFGILGPNGAGKTTTMEILEGMRRPDSGRVLVAGVDVRKQPRKVKSLIGVQLQSSNYLSDLNLIELLNLFASLYHRRVDARALLERVGLTEKSKSVFLKMSGGQKQRFSIAVALVNEPRILFLDEPTTGLDPQGRRNLWDLVQSIRSEGRTVVLTTHYMEEAETLCERVAIMDRGKILALDRPETLVQRLLNKGFRRQRVEREANLEDVFIDLTGRALRDR